MKTERNNLSPCGSGFKYKRCCARKEANGVDQSVMGYFQLRPSFPTFWLYRPALSGDEAEMGGQDGGTVFGGNEQFCGNTIADGFQGVAHKYYLA